MPDIWPTGSADRQGARTISSNTSTAGLRRTVLISAGAGVLAAVMIAMYAMLAAYAKDTGFFTPM